MSSQVIISDDDETNERERMFTFCVLLYKYTSNKYDCKLMMSLLTVVKNVSCTREYDYDYRKHHHVCS